jgi:hypothetical protein
MKPFHYRISNYDWHINAEYYNTETKMYGSTPHHGVREIRINQEMLHLSTKYEIPLISIG